MVLSIGILLQDRWLHINPTRETNAYLILAKLKLVVEENGVSRNIIPFSSDKGICNECKKKFGPEWWAAVLLQDPKYNTPPGN